MPIEAWHVCLRLSLRPEKGEAASEQGLNFLLEVRSVPQWIETLLTTQQKAILCPQLNRVAQTSGEHFLECSPLVTPPPRVGTGAAQGKITSASPTPTFSPS